jgi:hypothetical protein
MSALFAIAVTTGILSALWGWMSISLGLLTWAGFLGCTSYFASPKEGVKGLGTSLIANMSGVFWAMVIIHGSGMVSLEIIGFVITGIVSFMMCIQAKQALLGYIPGTFIGCCATFAASGNWQLVVPSIIVGGVFGYLMKATGLYLKAYVEKQSAKNQTEATSEVTSQA